MLALAAQQNPDERAKIQFIAKARGLPVEVVEAGWKHGTPAQKAALQTPYDALLRESPATARWLSDPRNAELASDDVARLAGLERQLSRMGRPNSWLGELGSSTVSGFIGLKAGYGHLGAALGALSVEDAAEITAAAHQSQAERLSRRPAETAAYRRRIEEASGLGVAMEALSSPSQLAILVAENLGFSAPAIAGGAAGTAVAGPAGLVGGVFAGGAMAEFGAWVDQEIGRAGYDLTDPGSVAAAYRNAPLMERIHAEATRKALVTAAFDAATAAFGGKLVAKTTGALRRTAAVGKELTTQSVSEAAGEAAGQLAATGAVDIDEAILEGVASLGQSGAEITLGAIARPALRQAARAAQAAQDAEAARGAAGLWKESKLAQRLPERLRGLVQAQAEALDPEIGEVHIDREAFDAYAAAQGMAPVELAAKLVPVEGAKVYAESASTGQVSVRFGSLVEALADADDAEGLLAITRFRADGLTLAEVAEEQAAIETGTSPEAVAAITEEVEKAATLAQADQTEARRAELDEEIAALSVPRETPEALIPPALAASAEALTDEQLLAVAEAAEQGGEGLAEVLAGVEGANALLGDPGAVAGAARGLVEQRGRQARLEALRAEKDALGEPGQPEAAEVGQRLRERLAGELTTAGRGEAEASILAELLVRGYEVLAGRTGLALADFAERFVTSVKASQAERAPKGKDVLPQRRRGFLERGTKPDGSRVFDVTLLSRANRSTFLHESGHVFLEILADLAGDEAAPQPIRDDFAAVLSWLGVESRDQLDVAQHEQWARGFEMYLREGKAPSAALRRAFAAFRAWLTRIYRDLRGLGVELTPSVRSVMDRLLATDAEIEAAQYEVGVPTLPAEALAAMSEIERASYLRAARAAQDAATERLTRDELLSQEEQRKAERGEVMDRLRAEARAVVEAMPAVRALSAMQAGQAEKLDRAATTVEHGKHAKALDKLGLLTDEGGLTPSQVAETFGVPSADDLIAGLLQAGKKDAWIDRMARERLRQEFPELLSRPEVRALARRAVANEERSELLLAEVKRLQRLADRQAESAEEQAGESGQREAAAARRAEDAEEALLEERAYGRIDAANRRRALDAVPTLPEIRAAAQAVLDKLPLGRILPHVYLSAARRESNRAAGRVRVGAWYQAAEAKRLELFNHELFRIATKMQRKAERTIRRGHVLATASYQERAGRAGQGYREQMNALLERFGFPAPRSPADRPALATWVAGMTDEGIFAPDIAPWLLDESFRASPRELTAQRLQDVRDAIEQIYTAANNTQKLLADVRGFTIEQRRRAVADAVARHKEPRKARPEDPEPLPRRIWFGLRAIDSLAYRMDGSRDGGVVWDALVRPVNESAAQEQQDWNAIGDGLVEIHKQFTAEDRANWTKRSRIPGVRDTLSLQERFMVALNWGNREGRQRLLFRFSPDEIRAILNSLEVRHAEAARQTWELEDSFWARAKALWERIKGVAPPKVEALSFTTRTADGKEIQWRGGYHRLMYAGTAFFHELTSEEQAARIERGDAFYSVPKSGSMIERKTIVRAAPRLDFGVVTSHLSETIHMLSHLEALRDVRAVLAGPEVKQAILERYGKAVFEQFASAYQDVAAGSYAANDAMAQAIGYLRAGTIVMRLGWRVTTNLINLGGITQAIPRVGLGNMLRALTRLLREPARIFETAEAVYAVSPTMRLRDQTFQREVAEQQRKFHKLSPVRDVSQRMVQASFALMALGQRAVDLPIWMAAFEKAGGEIQALREGRPVAALQEAVAIADQAVIATQGSGRIGDMAAAFRGSEWKKLWTTFTGFTSRTLSVAAESTGRTSFRSPEAVARWAADMLFVFWLPAVWSVAIQQALRGDEDDEEVWRSVLRETGALLLGPIPFLREGSGVVLGLHDYSGPAGAGFVQEGIRFLDQLGQGEADEGLGTAASRVAGIAAHLPTTQALESYRGLRAWLEGRAPPTAVLLGPPRER